MAVNLQKGQKISLEKEAGGALSKVAMGLGWDVKQAPAGLFGKKKEKTIDLDASCVVFDANGALVDTVWFGQLKSKDGSISHSGDNLTGAGDGDDETITVDLTRVSPNVKSLVFTVSSFTGQTFAEVERAFCRIVNSGNGREIARYDLSAQGAYTAQILAKLYRHGSEWKMAAIGETGNGRTFEALLPLIKPHL
ncbi:MAG: TerD family protein [Deltaproteobacteria bacterium]|nr:TerD family protein [Deltaproteobacteria bacterium]